MKPWYEALFENYARRYDGEGFTQGTLGECDFLERELGGERVRLLDVGCGTGRHAIELAKRGFSVVGVDLSEAQLRRAREKANEAGVDVEFRQADARELPFENEFDAAIMICEGGFSLMETDAMDYAILKGAARALKPGGKFVFTALNALFPILRSTDFLSEPTQENGSSESEMEFDLETFRQSGKVTFTDDDGVERTIETNERFYAPSEIRWRLESLGFRSVEIFGAKLGAFSREDKPTPDDFELLTIATK